MFRFGFRGMFFQQETKFCVLSLRASLIVLTCSAITDRTPGLIRLNSSKYAHASVYDRPEKKFCNWFQVTASEQLKTTQKLAIAIAKSLTVSIFPVPIGPAGDPPRWCLSALVRVR